MLKEITEQENDFIEAIRNYRNRVFNMMYPLSA